MADRMRRGKKIDGKKLVHQFGTAIDVAFLADDAIEFGIFCSGQGSIELSFPYQ